METKTKQDTMVMDCIKEIIGGLYDFVKEKDKLESENKKLKAEVEKLKAEAKAEKVKHEKCVAQNKGYDAIVAEDIEDILDTFIKALASE